MYDLKEILLQEKMGRVEGVARKLLELIFQGEQEWKNFETTKQERNSLPEKILFSVRELSEREVDRKTVQSWVDTFVSIMNSMGLMDRIECQKQIDCSPDEIVELVIENKIDWEGVRERFPELRELNDQALTAVLLKPLNEREPDNPNIRRILDEIEVVVAEGIKIPCFAVRAGSEN